MSTSNPTPASQAPSTPAASASTSRSAGTWTEVSPVHVDYADALPTSKVEAVWQKMYRAAGLASATEKEKKGLRAAVYLYGLINGTSREGAYPGELRLFNGTAVPASIIPTSVGSMEIRKFFRSNMIESYDYFKESGIAETEARLVSRAAGLGIAASEAFTMADWLADCPRFTPAESRSHERAFTYAVRRSNGARGGNSLEDVEEKRLDKSLAAQSNGDHSPMGRAIDF